MSTFPETNKSHLKIDGCKMTFLLGPSLVFRVLVEFLLGFILLFWSPEVTKIGKIGPKNQIQLFQKDDPGKTKAFQSR